MIAEQQYITYNEFLPALGIGLPAYRGYNPDVNADLGNEFATVGYRAHSMIHGEIEVEADADRYTPATLDALEAQGVEVEPRRGRRELELAVPLNVAFFNPDLVALLQLGPLLQGIGLEARVPQRRADRQPAAQRAVPGPGRPATRSAWTAPTLPECFQRRRRPRCDRHRARPRPRHARPTTSCGAAYGLAAEDRRSRPSPVRTPRASRPIPS